MWGLRCLMNDQRVKKQVFAVTRRSHDLVEQGHSPKKLVINISTIKIRREVIQCLGYGFWSREDIILPTSCSYRGDALIALLTISWKLEGK